MPAMCPVHHNFLNVNAVTNAGKGIRYKQVKSVTALKVLLAADLYLCITLSYVGYNCIERTAQITWQRKAI